MGWASEWDPPRSSHTPHESGLQILTRTRKYTPLEGNRAALARRTNRSGLRGTADDVLRGRRAGWRFWTGRGVSRRGAPDGSRRAIVFAMANPTPEVHPEEVRDDVAIIATGRSDYPNQINNVLAFPGVFKAGGAHPAAAHACAGERDAGVSDRVDRSGAVVVDAHADPLWGDVARVLEWV
jgi:hypothetical protein